MSGVVMRYILRSSYISHQQQNVNAFWNKATQGLREKGDKKDIIKGYTRTVDFSIKSDVPIRP